MAKVAPSRFEHSPRGLEIVEPCPGILRAWLLLAVAVCLPVLLILLLDETLTLAVSAALWVVGRTTAGLALLAGAVLLWWDGRSRWLYRFARGRMTRMLQVGPLTLWREEVVAAKLVDAGIDPASPGVLRLERAIGEPMRIRFTDADPARRAAAAVQAWRADPDSGPQAAQQGLAEQLAETGLSLLLTRLRHAPALLLLGAALLGIAAALQLLRGDGSSSRELAIAEGELLRYRVEIREPDSRERRLGHTEGKAWVELGVAWRDGSGALRQSWWRSRGDADVSRLAEQRLWPLGRSIGLPWLEFALPDAALAAWTDENGQLTWQLDAVGEGGDAVPRELVRQADRLLDNLAVLHFARAPDWRIAYDPAAPQDARLLRWQEDEQGALQASPRMGLAVLLVLSAVLAWGALLWLLAGRSGPSTMIWIALLAASPWWSAQAARVPGWLGLPEGIADGVSSLFRSTAPLALRGHALLDPLPVPTPDDPRRLLRWEPMASQAAGLLPELGLDRLPLPIAAVDDAAQAGEAGLERARDAVRAVLAARVLEWSDADLVDFLRRLRPEAYGRFNDVLINLPDCELAAQATRSAVTRQWIDAVLRPECEVP